MFRTTIKNLLARKLRLLTTGLAVLLGVAFVAGTLVVTDTVRRTFDNLFTDVFAGTDAQVRAEEPFDADHGPGSTRPRVDAALVELVAGVDGVADAEGDTFGFAQIIGSDGEAIGGQGPPTFGGAWTTNDELNTWDVAQGRGPRADGEVIIDGHSAEDGDLEVGDRTRVITQSGAIEVTVVGIARFGGFASPGGSTFAGFAPESAQRYLGEPDKFDTISVVAEEGVSEEEVRDAIAAALPDGVEVITGTELTEENQDDVQQFVDIIGNAMLAFALIALFVGSFIIYNTFSILVAQRTRELALLRAIGASRRQVRASVLLEALVVGLVASVIGLVAGVGVAIGLKALLDAFGLELPAEGLAVRPPTIITSLLLGTVITVVAAWFPARRGSRIPPLAAMRDVAFEQAGRPRLRALLGALLLGFGALALFGGLFGESGKALPLVGFGALLILLGVTALGPLVARPATALLGRPLASLRGTSGVLARENAMRNPRRTSTTASALMIGVALVGFITIFASSVKASLDKVFDEQFTGDFVLDSGSFGFGGASTDMAERLRELPQLSAVSPLRTTAAQFDGEGVQLQAFDADHIGQIADFGVQQGRLEDLDERSVAVLDEKAQEEGWTIGSTVPIRFPETGELELTVQVIFGNNELGGRSFMNTALFDAHVPTQFDNLVFAKVADDSSIEEARPGIEAIAADYGNVEVQDRDEFIADRTGFIDLILNLVYVLLALAIVIALFGIANTLALSIVERTRELGLLRAVGMTRAQLRSMIRWEAVLIALFGTVAGLAVGTFFGWAMFRALEDEGFRAFRVPVGQLLVIALLAAVFGVAAAILPARRAGRLNVLDAIATE